MPTYVIVDISVFDPEEYESNKKLSLPSLTPFNGKIIVRGGETLTLEGDWHPDHIVVLEFPSKEKALEWWNSDIYAVAKAIRHETALTKMIVVEGI